MIDTRARLQRAMGSIKTLQVLDDTKVEYNTDRYTMELHQVECSKAGLIKLVGAKLKLHKRGCIIQPSEELSCLGEVSYIPLHTHYEGEFTPVFYVRPEKKIEEGFVFTADIFMLTDLI